MDMTLSQMIDLASRLGVVLVLLINIFAFVRGILTKQVVPGWAYDEIKADRDRLRVENELLRNYAFRAVSGLERAVGVLEQAPTPGGEQCTAR
jgi:hypothetical protein